MLDLLLLVVQVAQGSIAVPLRGQDLALDLLDLDADDLDLQLPFLAPAVPASLGETEAAAAGGDLRQRVHNPRRSREVRGKLGAHWQLVELQRRASETGHTQPHVRGHADALRDRLGDVARRPGRDGHLGQRLVPGLPRVQAARDQLLVVTEPGLRTLQGHAERLHLPVGFAPGVLASRQHQLGELPLVGGAQRGQRLAVALLVGGQQGSAQAPHLARQLQRVTHEEREPVGTAAAQAFVLMAHLALAWLALAPAAGLPPAVQYRVAAPERAVAAPRRRWQPVPVQAAAGQRQPVGGALVQRHEPRVERGRPRPEPRQCHRLALLVLPGHLLVLGRRPVVLRQHRDWLRAEQAG